MTNTQLDAGQAGTEWHDVRDGLPQEGRQVLVTKRSKNGYRGLALAYVATDADGRVWWAMQGTAEVVAWAELPTPYGSAE